MELFFDRNDDYNYAALWVGRCLNKDILADYVFSRYLGDDLTGEEFDLELEKMFIAKNADREVEEELRMHFSAGSINQFQYDFAVVFDEAGTGCDVRDFYTESLRNLITGSPNAGVNWKSLIEKCEQSGITLPEPCNSYVLIPTKYEGYYSHIYKRERKLDLWYMGTFHLT